MIVHQLESRHYEEYAYRGEGNANLVVSLPLTRSVLRFRKVNSAQEAKDGKTRILFEWRFFSKYISKFMVNFVTEPSVIQCHPRDFKNWNEKVEVLRPGHRKHQTAYEKYAIKLSDYAQLPEHLDVDGKTRKSTFCVEIKPKQGFVPESDRHIRLCPYCINQFDKVANKTVAGRSKYCPCDLFSGDRKRLHRAIDALIETPQNNFILFKNGCRVWGEGYSRDMLNDILKECFGSNQVPVDDLRHLLCEALLREFSNKKNQQRTTNCDQLLENNAGDERHTSSYRTCNFTNGNLPEESVLGRLFSIQKMHNTSTEDVYRLYLKHSTKLNEEIVFFSEPDDYECNRNNIDFSDILILRNYLLFCTARDCSVLLAFQQLDVDHISKLPEGHVITTVDGSRTFVLNIGVTDLDPKGLNRIEMHYQRQVNYSKLVECQPES